MGIGIRDYIGTTIRIHYPIPIIAWECRDCFGPTQPPEGPEAIRLGPRALGD